MNVALYGGGAPAATGAPGIRLCHCPDLLRGLGRPKSSATDDERGAHAALAVVGERAPEGEATREEPRLELSDAARPHVADPIGPGPARAAQAKVVLILSVVDELHDH